MVCLPTLALLDQISYPWNEKATKAMRQGACLKARELVKMTAQKLNANFNSATRIIFSGDILRVDDTKANKFENPAENNVRWMKSLLAKPLMDSLNVPSTHILLTEGSNELNRREVYEKLDIPFSTSGWASIYNGALSEEITTYIRNLYKDSLVITYELPPYLKEVFDNFEIPYIDFTLHPIRFLSDFIFGVRTNIDAVDRQLKSQRLPDSAAELQARIMAGRSLRRLSNPDLRIPEGAVVFFGQTNVDASLIHEGQHASDIDVEIALSTLAEEYGRVYYKGHPHRNYKSWIEGVCKRNSRIKVLDRNVYDILGSGSVEIAASLSSGTLVEAQYFGIKIHRFLDNYGRFHQPWAEVEFGQYYPVFPTVLDSEFWRATLIGGTYNAGTFSPRLSDGLLKEALNAKWGK